MLKFYESINIIDSYAEKYGTHSTTYKAFGQLLNAIVEVDKVSDVMQKEAKSNVEYFNGWNNYYENLDKWSAETRREYDKCCKDKRVNSQIVYSLEVLQDTLVDMLNAIAETITADD